MQLLLVLLLVGVDESELVSTVDDDLVVDVSLSEECLLVPVFRLEPGALVLAGAVLVTVVARDADS